MSVPRELADHDRYRVIRELGEGGLGVVYLVEDRDRGQEVALKTFRRSSYDAIFRLKREFRALAGISHPNLATLYDLHTTEEWVFFTMELVEGQNVLDYVCHGVDDSQHIETLPPGQRPMQCVEERLRAVLPQIAAGLAALHDAGKIHRDIKPSNVRVTPDGRVKILDFGLAVDIHEVEDETLRGGVVGTVLYMSPEQAAADAVTPATDWYAFGALAYEAITGLPPFTGGPMELIAKKTQGSPAPPRQSVPDVPRDLDQLVEGLLHPDPHRRLSGAQVLEALRIDLVPASSRTANTSPTHLVPFTGRDRELGRLVGALRDVQFDRQPRAVVVAGASGMGKSTLVSEFIARARSESPGVVVLRGRCYEWEDIAYNAIDGVVDELSRVWRKLDPVEAERLVPVDAHLLPVAFPVLGRVAPVAAARLRHQTDEVFTRRDKAFAALRDTLVKLSDGAPVVMFVDDMQWADPESIRLLGTLVERPDAPAMLLVLGTRPEALDGDTGLSALLVRLGAIAETVELDALDAANAVALARYSLGPAAAPGGGDEPCAAEQRAIDELAQQIAVEGRGSPFFITELGRFLRGQRAGDLEPHASVDDLIRARLEAVDPRSRGLLEVVCVAGEPLSREVAEAASNMTDEAFAEALKPLRLGHLVRAAMGREHDEVEPYHDRIREAVVQAVGPERRRAIHLALASALEPMGSAVADRLARHYRAAGLTDQAAQWAERAGHESARSLNFSRAAELFQIAYDLGSGDSEQRRRLLVAIGNARSEAGAPRAAAEAFEQAATSAPEAEAIDLLRRASETRFFAGDLETGESIARTVARQVGMGVPGSSVRTLARLVGHEIALRLRAPRLGRGSRRAERHRVRANVAYSVGKGLAVIDPLRGFLFIQRFVREARRCGDAEQFARSVALLSISSAVQGSARIANRLREISQEASARANGGEGSPTGDAYVYSARSFYAYYIDNDWRSAIGLMSRARYKWTVAQRGWGIEMVTAAIMRGWSHYYLGNLRDAAHEIPREIDRARQNGNTYLQVSLRAFWSPLALIRDRPDEALGEIEDALGQWSDPALGYQVQHFFGLLRAVETELYAGRPRRALARLAADWPLLKRSLLLRAVSIEAEYWHLVGRAHISAALLHDSDQRQHLAIARRAARRLRRRSRRLPRMLGLSLAAAISHIEHNDYQALEQLRDALALANETHTGLYRAACAHRIGVLLGGATGDEQCLEAARWYADEGVTVPERMTNMLLPGWS